MRESGVLLHISSLPNSYGIGSVGKEARKFAKNLAAAGCGIWQILPINPTSFGDSPYQSFCSFAGNVYFIDLDELVEEGLLKKSDLPIVRENGGRVDYGELYRERYETLEKAFDYSYKEISDMVEEFSSKNPWLDDFALFMALKEKFCGASWQDFPEQLKRREKSALSKAKAELQKQIDFHKYTQYLFAEKWQKFKEYVNSLGVKIMGDIPIYVALDSSDVWANPKAFKLDENLCPTEVAGVPPDYFCEDGQLWGNPIYDIDHLKKTDYKFWTDRIKKATEYYDVIRLDHFIGFANYYSVPYGYATAKNGRWNDGMGEELFSAIKKSAGKVRFVAEDLGVLSDKVVALKKKLGLSGMKVLQFSFDPDKEYLYPKDYEENSVVYTGTHDNDTTYNWYMSLDERTQEYVKKVLGVRSEKTVVRKMLELCFGAKSLVAIVPAQDLLPKNVAIRMNNPGVPDGNWQFCLKKGQLNSDFFKKLRRLNEKYGRGIE